MARAEGNESASRFSSLVKAYDKELRQHVGLVEGVGWGWEALPIAKFGDAMAKLRSIDARADRAIKVTAKAAAKKPTQAQLGLHVVDEVAP